MKEKCEIIFIGAHSCGKTTYYNTFLSKDYIHINFDILQSIKKETECINECIKNGRNFVIDNTNLTRHDRKKYISSAKGAGYKVVGYFFKSNVIDCIIRNTYRPENESVHMDEIAESCRKIEKPSIEEGFDELYYIDCYFDEITDKEVKVKVNWDEMYDF